MKINNTLCEEKFNLKHFEMPSSEHFPCYAWVWNAELDENEIRKQIDNMYKMDIKTIYVIAESKSFRTNLYTELYPNYMSNEYLKFVKYAVEYCKSKKMNFWIYDEDAWPSGTASGKVVRSKQALIQKRIIKKTVQLIKGEKLSGNIIAAFDVSGESVSLPHTAHTNEKIDIFSVEKCEPYNNPYPDLFNSESTERFIELTHEKYKSAFGGKLPENIFAVFTDEPNLAHFPWTESLKSEFNKMFGYNYEEYLPQILNRCNVESAAAVDYYDCMTKLLAQNYYYRIAQWCKKNDVIFTGHTDGDHDINCFEKNGSVLRMLREMTIPGIDVIMRQIFPAKKTEIVYKAETDKTLDTAINTFFPRLASSVANQMGKRYALTESFAVYGAGITYEQMRYVLNFQMIRGINMINIMTLSYGKKAKMLTGMRPTFSSDIPGNDCLKYFNKYYARLSYIMSLGKRDVKVALYYPQRDVWAGGAQAKISAESYENIGKFLEYNAVDFDICDDDFILDSVIENKTMGEFSKYEIICVGKTKYMKKETAEKLEKFKEIGGIVIYEDELERKKNLLPQLTEDNANGQIIMCRRNLADGNVLNFMFNEGLSANTVKCSFEKNRNTFKLDLNNGQITSVNPDIKLTLQSGELAAYISAEFSETLPAERKSTIKTVILNEFEFKVLNEVAFDGVLKKIEINDEYKKASFENSLKKSFSGEIMYRCYFKADSDLISASEIWIELDKVAYSAEVFVNNVSIGWTWSAPYRLRIPKGIIKKNNCMKIKVASTGANAYLCSEELSKLTFERIGYYHSMQNVFEMDTTDCGLSGEVKLIYINYKEHSC